MSDDGRGIYRKYIVTRTDGGSAPGGKHERCAYFVLDLEHDEYAVDALRAYAKACRKADPERAAGVDAIADAAPVRCGCREACCPHSLMSAFEPGTPSEMAHALMADATTTKEPT